MGLLKRRGCKYGSFFNTVQEQIIITCDWAILFSFQPTGQVKMTCLFVCMITQSCGWIWMKFHCWQHLGRDEAKSAICLGKGPPCVFLTSVIRLALFDLEQSNFAWEGNIFGWSAALMHTRVSLQGDKIYPHNSCLHSFMQSCQIWQFASGMERFIWLTTPPDLRVPHNIVTLLWCDMP